MKTVENAEHKLISDPQNPAIVCTERTAFVSNQVKGEDMRPDAFMVSDHITYADGNSQNVHLSFANISVAEQNSMNWELENYVDIQGFENPGDGLRGQMSAEEYSLVMMETDQAMPTISQEFSYDGGIFGSAEHSEGMSWSISDGVGMSSSADAGVSATADTGVSVSSDVEVDSSPDSN